MNDQRLNCKRRQYSDNNENINETVLEIEQINKDPEYYFYEYFEKIKRDVDIRREDLKLKIDNYSDRIIDIINNAQTNSMKLAKKIDIAALRAEIDELAKNINSLEENMQKLNSEIDAGYGDFQSKNQELIKKKYVSSSDFARQGTELVLELDDLLLNIDSLEQYKRKLYNETDAAYDDIFSKQQDLNDLFMNHKYHPIDHKDYILLAPTISEERIFGSLVIKPMFHFSSINDSSIIKNEQIKKLMNLCGFRSVQTFNLLYKGSRDGFSAEEFHEKCDGFRNTLTIIKSTNDYIFGGYTEAAWDSSGKFIKDPNSFIFSLVNYRKKPFKSKCNYIEKSILCSSSYGPSFGRNDLRIGSNSNSNNNSISYLGRDYENEENGLKILTNSLCFKTKEIEVYKKVGYHF